MTIEIDRTTVAGVEPGSLPSGLSLYGTTVLYPVANGAPHTPYPIPQHFSNRLPLKSATPAPTAHPLYPLSHMSHADVFILQLKNIYIFKIDLKSIAVFCKSGGIRKRVGLATPPHPSRPTHQ